MIYVLIFFLAILVVGLCFCSRSRTLDFILRKALKDKEINSIRSDQSENTTGILQNSLNNENDTSLNNQLGPLSNFSAVILHQRTEVNDTGLSIQFDKGKSSKETIVSQIYDGLLESCSSELSKSIVHQLLPHAGHYLQMAFITLFSDLTRKTLNLKEIQNPPIDSSANVSNVTEIKILKVADPHHLKVELTIRVPTEEIENNTCSIPLLPRKQYILAASTKPLTPEIQRTKYENKPDYIRGWSPVYTSLLALSRIAIPIILHSLAYSIPTVSIHEVMEYIRTLFHLHEE